jgi:hypothetical protein
VVGFTTGSRGEVPGKKENLPQENNKIIIVKNKKGRTCLLIDVAIPSGRNVI